MCGLFDLTTNNLGDQLCRQLRKCAARGFPLNDFHHLLANGSNLGGSSVCGLLDLIRSSLREGDSEKSEEIIVCSFDSDICFNQRLPFANERPKLVGGKIEPMKVGKTIFPLDFVHPELDLPESMIFVLLQIGKRHFEYSSLQCIICIFKTGGPVDECFADIANLEGGRSLWKISKLFILARPPENTFTEYQSLRVKGSCVLFFRPFFPFESRLFLSMQSAITFCEHRGANLARVTTYFPTAMIATSNAV